MFLKHIKQFVRNFNQVTFTIYKARNESKYFLKICRSSYLFSDKRKIGRPSFSILRMLKHRYKDKLAGINKRK